MFPTAAFVVLSSLSVGKALLKKLFLVLDIKILVPYVFDDVY